MTFRRLTSAALTALFLSFLPLNATNTPPQTTIFNVMGPRGNTASFDYRNQGGRSTTILRAQRSHAAAASNTSGGPGVIETLVGVPPFQQPQTASTAGLGTITGIATDKNGNTFVAAQDFRTVLKIDSAGNVTVFAGQPLASGALQATGDGGPATAATLVSPQGLAVDSAGNLYIADQGSFTVRMVATSTGIITTVAGTPGQSGFSPDGTLAVNALLDGPSSLAIDASGNIFIVDGVLKRVDHGTGELSQYGGTNNFCQVLSNTQTCPIASMVLEPSYSPSGIAISNGNLYIAVHYITLAYSSYTGSILSVQLNTGITQLLAGGGESAPSVPGNTAIGANIDPRGLVVDSAGNIEFTAGSGPEVFGATSIMQLPLNGTSLTTIAGTGQLGSAGDGGSATAAEILSAMSIAVAPSGDLLFAEPSRIRSIDATGKIATFAGTGTDNYFGDGGPAQMAGISDATDTIADTNGNLYIADTGNGVVRRIDALTGTITTIAGNGGFASYGQGNASANSLPGDGGLATKTPLGRPRALALGAGNNLYIGDYYQVFGW